MNYPDQNSFSNDSVSGSGLNAAETTLRLIASLPAPEGLEDRVQAGLLAAPRRGRILAWPAALAPGSGWMRSGWMRSAAAAAIVFVVAGGGWGVYSRVQQPQQARVIVLPPHGPAQGGFSSAGAMRTPQTLNGPVLAHPVTAQPLDGKVPGKASARTVPKPLRHGQSAAANKANAQAVAPLVK
jgi:hypothetical protein